MSISQRVPQRLLVLSLGNPSEYNGTRHSVGHYILSRLISRTQAQSTTIGRFHTYRTTLETTDVWFYSVPGYMNLSGKSVTPFFKNFTSQIGESSVIVLFDELDLDLGKVKVRKQGLSHRGHNGLRNIQSSSPIGKSYTGIQLGIGRYYNGDKQTPGVVANYVLSKFNQEEREILDDVVVDKVIALLNEMCINGKYVFDK